MNNMDPDDFQIIEDTGGSYSDKGATTFQEILIQQVSRCARIGSQEMKAGFWKTIPTRFGGTATGSQKIWISDTRKEYISAIQVLHDLLLARFDDTMKEKTKEILNKIKERKNKYAKENILETKFVEYEILMHRQLFQQLNLLIGRLGYFKEGEGSA
ncbi:MAG TPA: hypothetical protein VMZ91_03350 [Candidatus Paceibacterota bacterium]|nr:hypothetical protein [Candidatus Paceibacterota bacterium]